MRLFDPKQIEFYSGYKNGEKGNWDSLISETIHKKLLPLIMKQSSERSKIKYTYLLSDIGNFFCGYCGGSMVSARSQRKSHSDFYYICSHKQMRGNVVCPESKVIRMNIVDEKVISDLKNRYNNISFIEKYTKTEVKNYLLTYKTILNDTISGIDKLRYNNQLEGYENINTEAYFCYFPP